MVFSEDGGWRKRADEPDARRPRLRINAIMRSRSPSPDEQMLRDMRNGQDPVLALLEDPVRAARQPMHRLLTDAGRRADRLANEARLLALSDRVYMPALQRPHDNLPPPGAELELQRHLSVLDREYPHAGVVGQSLIDALCATYGGPPERHQRMSRIFRRNPRLLATIIRLRLSILRHQQSQDGNGGQPQPEPQDPNQPQSAM